MKGSRQVDIKFGRSGLNKNRSALQTGLSLIELMIAMLIGLFLLLSISSVYLSNLKSSKARDQYSQLEDNARLALESMSKIIEHTGYAEKVVMFGDKFITQPVVSNQCVVNNNALFNTFGSTADDDSGAKFTGDKIGVIYLASTELNVDCTGNVAPPKCQLGDPLNKGKDPSLSRIYNAFFVEQQGSDGKLVCLSSLAVGKQVIADNIENMQITYGIDTNGDDLVDQYVDASNVPGGNWNSILSAQIALLVRSDKEVKDKAEQKTYTLLNKQITAPQGAGNKDRFQRAVFSTTVQLKNN